MKIHLEHKKTKEIKVLDLPGVKHAYEWIVEGGFEPYENEYIIEFAETFDNFDNEEAYNILQKEGYEYALLNYCHDYDFKDPETRKLWRNAQESVKKLSEHLEEYENF